MKKIFKGLVNQDLVVVHEHFKTPTAQLADFILPGDSWLERPHLFDCFGFGPFVQASEKAMDPPGECRDVFDFWRQLALRFGLEEHFPWRDVNQMLDYRLRDTGMTFNEFSQKYRMYLPTPSFRKYEKHGFATPSGKVEIKSSILEGLGFDSLPYYREAPKPNHNYPLTLFMGVRDDPYFQTGHRHVPELRRRCPDPKMFINPTDATSYDIKNGDWIEIETKAGSMSAMAEVRDDMPANLIRVPHGWWKPEIPAGLDGLSGAWQHSDAQITSDDEEFVDAEQGIPHLKGIPCRIAKSNVSQINLKRIKENDSYD